MKTFKLRDSATAFLKKMGIPKEQYNTFIKKFDGMHHVDEVSAIEWLEDNQVPPFETDEKPEVKKPEVKKPEVKKPEVKKPEVKKPEVKKPEVKKPEVKKPVKISPRCRELISQGLSNIEVWEKVKAEFDLDDSKKSYVAWNRSYMRRLEAAQ